VTPADAQHPLGSLPVNAVWSPTRDALVVADAGGGGQSLQVVADAIDEREFNRQIWKGVRGARAEPPAPVYHVLPPPSSP
jgi:hypothetical protein